MPSPFTIRTALIEDLPAIVDIHNQAIGLPYANAYTEPFDAAQRVNWFDEHKGTNPIFVAVDANKNIAGWLSVSPYRSGRAALQHTKEVSYYIGEAYKGNGIATALLHHAMDAVHQLNARVYIAVVIDKNTPSIRLLEKNGFRLWGHLQGVATFGDEQCGHYYFGWTAK